MNPADCPTSPVPGSHYWTHTGAVWTCTYCTATRPYVGPLP